MRGGFGGLTGAREIAGVDRREALVLERVGGGARLGVAECGEGNVELALDAAAGVPGGLTVADQTEAGHGL
jgi:hypothetical protein